MAGFTGMGCGCCGSPLCTNNAFTCTIPRLSEYVLTPGPDCANLSGCYGGACGESDQGGLFFPSASGGFIQFGCTGGTLWVAGKISSSAAAYGSAGSGLDSAHQTMTIDSATCSPFIITFSGTMGGVACTGTVTAHTF